MTRSAWIAVGLLLQLAAGQADARESLVRVPKGADSTRAVAYAKLSPELCQAELDRRNIPVTRLGPTAGVKIPVRLRGPLGGVLYRTDFPEEKRKQVPWEVFDCRLVLALHDFSHILQAHDVREVRIFSAWRPPHRRWPAGKIAKRHPGALAVDVRALIKDSGQVLLVKDHYNGRIGTETCGERAVPPSPATSEARELRSIVCEAADARIFNSILTPNYNRPHSNHFHLEVTAGVRWFLVR